jgi:hypothetical protein
MFDCDWSVMGCASITGTFGVISPAAATADYYLEIAFSAGSIPANGQSGEIQARIHKADWSNFNESNDFSFDATKTAFADWTKVALYQNGVLVWGTTP